VSEDSNDYCTIPIGDEDYPELLTQLRDPPQLLYVKGNVDTLHLPALAIVGSRNPTNGGERNAFEFSRHMAGCGFCIVSGLAQGIDSAAHRGAIDAGSSTVAFLGHGIDIVYPQSNRELADEIVQNGALVSEYPPGTPPLKAYFPQRNRLISGLSLGTLVVEAARRSGSLITARLAAEQGREVFALPGSIHNPMARGCHQLLRDGAKLVESADDIMAELRPLATHVLQNRMESTPKEVDQKNDDKEYVKLRENLGDDPIGIDELVDASGLTIDQVSSMLLILELDGKIEKLSGGRYALLH
jgi:DNA processing protein